ncbi:MAG: RHS repeat-associated core domain-containing protein [Pseudomonadota bacterium]
MKMPITMIALPRYLHFLLAAALLILAGTAQAASQPYISAHQINFGTGNKYLSATDIRLSGPGIPLSFTRTYNSQSSETSAIGYGWTAPLTERLIVEPTVINLVQEGGRYVPFKNDGSGNWINETGNVRTITANGSGYQLKEANNTIKQFDGSGNLTSITDRNGNTRTYSYANNLLSTISDNFGRNLTFTYTNGKLTQITSPLGNFTYTYQNDNLTRVDKPDGTNIQYIYDDAGDAHNMTGIIDETGTRILTLTYDSQDRVTSSAKAGGADLVTIAYPTTTSREVTNSLGVKTTYQLDVLHGVAMVGSMVGPGCSSCGGNANTKYTYNSRLQIIEATDANDVKTAYTYDEKGNTTKITKAFGTPLAGTTSKTYDPATNQLLTISRPSIANPGQQTVTSMTYDAQGNLITRLQSGYSGTTAISATTQYTYNSYGQITAIDGPRTDVSDVVNFTYYPNDASQGNNRASLQTVTNALGHATTFSDYNVFGQAETVTDANGIVTTRVYNASGLVTATTTAGLSTGYTYDGAGKLQTITLPGGRTITYTYNPENRLDKITDSLGNAISYSYDSEGRRLGEEIRDPANSLARYANYGYDDNGRMNKVTLPGPAEETAEYDLVGNLVKTVAATTLQTGYQYDVLNRLLSVIEAGTTTASYNYDAHDNIKTVTDANAKVTSFTYDDFGRRISRTAPDTGTTSYSYDQAGNLLTATDAKGQSVSFSYDALNRPISQSYAGGDASVFSYDQGGHAIGHLSGMTDREGTVGFTYDAAGRIASEIRTIGGRSYTTSYTWNATTGELAGMTYPSGMGLTYSRDAGGQITAVQAGGTELISAITHLPFGPLKSATLGSVNLSRAHDQRYNTSRITAGTFDYVYTRNAGGNVTSIANYQVPSVAGGQSDYSYNSTNNQLTAVSGPSPKTCTYDANGNILSDGTNTFTYDGLNRIIQVEKQGSVIATYGYDSSNRRIRKNAGTTSTHYLYDLGSQLIAEILVDGTKLRDYIYLDGEPIAVKEYQTTPGTYYFINDHLGTPQRLVNATGTVVWQAAYLPFGKAQITVETVKNNLRFPGQYYDAETGLHYNWHRFYDPETGRYISADPIGLDGGMNLYTYVSGNPLNWFDLDGLKITGYWLPPKPTSHIKADIYYKDFRPDLDISGEPFGGIIFGWVPIDIYGDFLLTAKCNDDCTGENWEASTNVNDVHLFIKDAPVYVNPWTWYIKLAKLGYLAGKHKELAQKAIDKLGISAAVFCESQKK